jgi:hypothetical protein
VKRSGAEVNVAPPQRQGLLGDARASCARQQREQGPGHPFRGCIQQGHQLLGLNPRAVRARGLQPAPLAARRVRLEQFVLHRCLKDLGEVTQRVVNRVVGETPFGCLLHLVRVHLLRGYLAQLVVGEERQQVIAQRPLEVTDGLLRESFAGLAKRWRKPSRE